MPTKKVLKEEIDIAFRKVEINEKRQKMRVDAQDLILNKISVLEDLLRSSKPSVASYPGQEVGYEPCITDPDHIDTITNKIMALVEIL